MTPIPYRFYSRDDTDSLRQLDEIFNRKGIFFIENKETQRWLEELTPSGGKFTTNDPHKAMRFEIYSHALTFAVKNRLIEPEGWTITEHEFI